VCLSVCGDISGTTRAIFTIFVHVAYVRDSVLRYVDDRLHRLSAGRGDGCAQRGRSVIYDCLVLNEVTPNRQITTRGSLNHLLKQFMSEN